MKSRASYSLWIEKYRPEKVEHMILPASYREYFKNVIKSGDVPNLLLYSNTPGTGKTTMAKALCNQMEVDYLYINSSKENGVDVLRSTITRFATNRSLTGKKKVVILDEFDGASVQIMQALRAFLEEYQNTCRFIITANYVNKIIEPLRSRLQQFDFNVTTGALKEELVPMISKRLKGILTAEKLSYDEPTIDKLAEENFPDIRSMLSLLQKYSLMNGAIDANLFSYSSVDDTLYELLIDRKFTAARQFVLDSGYNFDELYAVLYREFVPRLELAKQAQAIMSIAEWQYKSNFCADKEIPFAAMLLELTNLD